MFRFLRMTATNKTRRDSEQMEFGVFGVIKFRTCGFLFLT